MCGTYKPSYIVNALLMGDSNIEKNTKIENGVPPFVVTFTNLCLKHETNKEIQKRK